MECVKLVIFSVSIFLDSSVIGNVRPRMLDRCGLWEKEKGRKEKGTGRREGKRKGKERREKGWRDGKAKGREEAERKGKE